MNIRLMNIQSAQEQYKEIVNQYINTFPLTINTKLNNFAELILTPEEQEYTINAIVELLCSKKVALVLINYNRINNTNAHNIFDTLLTKQLYKSLIISDEICVYGMLHCGLLFGEFSIKS